MNKKQEKIVKQTIDSMVPKIIHNSMCGSLSFLGKSHDNCSCSCHEKKGSLEPSKEKRSAI